MKIQNPKKLENKELFVFDLDGTLTESKSPMDSQMAELITELLKTKSVAVISGGELKQFKVQFLKTLKGHGANYHNLFLFPTCSSIFYKYTNGKWKLVYAHYLKPSQVNLVMKAFKQAYKETGYKNPKKTYGPVIENRKTQVTFSALGQKVVSMLGTKGIKMKEDWSKKTDARPGLSKVLKRLLPGLEIRTGGATSIDVTRKGIDKAYGLRQIQKYLKTPINKMFFIGDAIFPGGNDYAVVKTGVDYLPVKGPEETKKILRKVL